MIIDIENTRIAKLGKYLETILEELNNNVFGNNKHIHIGGK